MEKGDNNNAQNNANHLNQLSHQQKRMVFDSDNTQLLRQTTETMRLIKGKQEKQEKQEKKN